MEPLISKSFRNCKTAFELWNVIETTYSQKRNHARIYQLTRELAQFKQGNKSLGDYYAVLRGMWHELSIYQPLNPCCAKEQENI